MYKEIFIYPVFIAVILLIIHSYRYRGKRETLIFWGGGYIILFIREYIYQNFMPVYRFFGVTLKILNVPITIPMGWLFAAYISLYISEYLLGINVRYYREGIKRIKEPGEYARNILPIIILACVIMATISFAIENTAVNMEWWGDFEGGQKMMNPGWLGGWMVTCFWFLTLILYITYPNIRLKRNILLVVLIWLQIAVGEPKEIYKSIFGGYEWFTFIFELIVLLTVLPALFIWRDYTIMYMLIQIFLVGFPSIISGIIPELTGFITMTVFITVILIFGFAEYRLRKPEYRIIPEVLL